MTKKFRWDYDETSALASEVNDSNFTSIMRFVDNLFFKLEEMNINVANYDITYSKNYAEQYIIKLSDKTLDQNADLWIGFKISNAYVYLNISTKQYEILKNKTVLVPTKLSKIIETVCDDFIFQEYLDDLK